MATGWTVTDEASDKTGESTIDLSTWYDAVSLHFDTVPDWAGYQYGVSSRKIYYRLGYLACAIQGGLVWEPQVIRYGGQLFLPRFGKVNRVFLYLEPGVQVDVQGANWTP